MKENKLSSIDQNCNYWKMEPERVVNKILTMMFTMDEVSPSVSGKCGDKEEGTVNRECLERKLLRCRT